MASAALGRAGKRGAAILKAEQNRPKLWVFKGG
jgi:hypothetical protein